VEMLHPDGVDRVSGSGGRAGGSGEAGGHELQGELECAGRVVLGQHGLLRAPVQPEAERGHQQVGEARREVAARTHTTHA
jgi:hypothetical protein